MPASGGNYAGIDWPLKRPGRGNHVPRFDHPFGGFSAETRTVGLCQQCRDLDAAANRSRDPLGVGDEIVDDLVSGGEAVRIDPGEAS